MLSILSAPKDRFCQPSELERFDIHILSWKLKVMNQSHDFSAKFANRYQISKIDDGGRCIKGDIKTFNEICSFLTIY